LAKNIENACMKARRYHLAAKGAILFVKTQDFRSSGVELAFSRPWAIPNDLIAAAAPPFKRLCDPRERYRATGVVLLHLESDDMLELDLFGEGLRVEKLKQLYQSVDEIRERYGKHTLYLGSSHPANEFAQHLGERGDIPVRRLALQKGETPRRRLGIPTFLGSVD
jgi:DNA polymerase-4/DNA polymerase V